LVDQALVADIGGTHARFALADVSGLAPHVNADTIVKLKAADHATIEAAIVNYLAQQNVQTPKRVSLAVATAVSSDDIRFTNSPWVFKKSQLKHNLGLDELVVLNDFGAVARAVEYLKETDLICLTGETQKLPPKGVISVIGAGTGLGVAAVVRASGHSHILETEGGHIGFAPADAVEIKILERLLGRYLRVSVERLVSGPGLVLLHESLAAIEGKAIVPVDDRTLWANAISGEDAFARASLERWCRLFGSVAGDVALVHLASGVVIAGGLVPRFLDILKQSDFLARFRAKGRFEQLMQTIPIFVCIHPDPGLLGAAAALMAD
jgi:glucokinase